MSTFTSINGGQCGPSGKDLVAYTKAYQTLIDELHEHAAKDVSSGASVHGIIDYISNALQAYLKIENFQATIQQYTEGTINTSVNSSNKLQTALDVLNKIEAVYNERSPRDLANYLSKTEAAQVYATLDKLTTELANYVKTAELASYSTTEQTSELIDSKVLQTAWEKLEASIIIARNYIKAKMLAFNSIDFVKWSSITARFAGTGGRDSMANQGCYVIGCISLDWLDNADTAKLVSTKSGRMYLKYVNSNSLDAILDFAVTKNDGEYTGAISATVSKKAGSWEDLRFHICLGTTSDSSSRATANKTANGVEIPAGTKVAYICVSAANLIGGSNDITNLQFFVAGENAIPIGEAGCVEPNGMLSAIASVYIGATPSGVFAASSGQFNELLSNKYLDANGHSILQVVEKDIATGDITKRYSYLFIGGNDAGSNYDQIVFTQRPCYIQPVRNEETGEEVDNLSYFVTAEDITNMAVPIGVIFRWAITDSEGKLTKIPEGFIACDGSQISAIDNPEYADLCELLGTDPLGYATLPNEEFSIIKYKYYNIYDKLAQPDYAQVIDFDILNKRLENEASARSQADNALDLRVKSAEDTVSAFDNELNNADNGLKKRVETVETDINNADSGLKKRVTVIETDLNDTDNGLKKKVADNTSTINANKGDADNKISSLDRRVSRYENVRAELEGIINLKDTESKARDKVITDTIGELTGLDTTDKSSVVAAINELNSNADNEASTRQHDDETLQGNIDTLQSNINAKIGELTDLDTTAKSTVIAAINELKGKADTNAQDIVAESDSRSNADAALITALTKLTNNVGLLEQLTTTEKESIVAAINELNSHIGDIATLSTENKGSVVEAINELDTDIGDTSKIITGDTTSLVAGLNNESNRRQNADRQLQSNIDTIEQESKDRDNALQSNIDNEATARGDKDTELDDRVTALENANG